MSKERINLHDARINPELIKESSTQLSEFYWTHQGESLNVLTTFRELGMLAESGLVNPKKVYVRIHSRDHSEDTTQIRFEVYDLWNDKFLMSLYIWARMDVDSKSWIIMYLGDCRWDLEYPSYAKRLFNGWNEVKDTLINDPSFEFELDVAVGATLRESKGKIHEKH